MRPRRHFRGGECAEPDAGLLAGLTNFGDPFAPVALPHAVVHRVLAAVPGPLRPALFLGVLCF